VLARFSPRFPVSLLWGLAAMTALGQTGQAFAQTYTWTGSAGSGNWGAAANWVTTSGSTVAPPTAGAAIVLAGGVQTTGSTGVRTATSLTFAANAGPFVINQQSFGNTLTLAGPVANLSGTVQSFNLQVSVSGTRTLDTGSSASGVTVFSQTVSGVSSPQLNIVGSGRAVFNASNNTISKVTVASGATVTGTGRLPSVAVQSGGSITPGSVSGTSYGTLTLGSGSTSTGGFVVNGGTSATVAVGISGTARGTAYDSFLVNGAGNQYGGVLSISFDNATAYAPDTVFNLFQLPHAIPSGNFNDVRVTGGTFDGVTFSGPVNGEWVSSANQTGQTLVFSQLTGNLVVVPEPSTVMIALSGLALVGFGRWRRRSTQEWDQARGTGWMIPLQ
jgi:hypothetical protein